MTFSDIQQQVQQLVRNASTAEALELLVDYVQQNNLSKGIEASLILNAKYVSLKEDFEIKGIVTRQEFELGINQVNVGIFNLLSKLKPGNHPSYIPASFSRRKILILVWALLAVLSGAGIWTILRPKMPDHVGSETSSSDSSASESKPVSDPLPALDPKKPPQTASEQIESSGQNTPLPTDTSNQTNEIVAFDVSLTVNADWSEAAVLVDGKEAEIVQRTLNLIKIRVYGNKASHTITLKMKGRVCEQKRLITSDTVLTFNCNEQ